jgi:hypothetical protein
LVGAAAPIALNRKSEFLKMPARRPHRLAMIENIRTHPYTHAVCLEAARLFERRAASDLVKAQCRADEGALDRARELQATARLAQQRAKAWHLRAKNVRD